MTAREGTKAVLCRWCAGTVWCVWQRVVTTVHPRPHLPLQAGADATELRRLVGERMGRRMDQQPSAVCGLKGRWSQGSRCRHRTRPAPRVTSCGPSCRGSLLYVQLGAHTPARITCLLPGEVWAGCDALCRCALDNKGVLFRGLADVMAGVKAAAKEVGTEAGGGREGRGGAG